MMLASALGGLCGCALHVCAQHENDSLQLIVEGEYGITL